MNAAEVGWLEGRRDAPGLDARKIEQRIDQFQQPNSVAVRHRDELATVGTEINFRQRQHLFERAQHQGEWRAKLMADIGEKRRLGPVDFRQRFRAPALLLVGSVH